MEAALTEAPEISLVRRSPVPWHCYLVVFAASCIAIGILWDISWHSTIGRDTFWTPAHMAIYLGGLVGGLCSGWLVLKTTFWGSEAERAASVRLWGLRGPIGAWVSIWGAAAMLTSAPFDDWWHNTYGLDVKILSPPHTVLAAGMHHLIVGALLLVLSFQNRSAGEGQNSGRGLFVFAGGLMVTLASILITEYSFPNNQHTGIFYKVSCALYPIVLVPVARASKLRWPATASAGVFMLFLAGLAWVLPLFHATPRLAPIFNPVNHMVPPAFPVLLIVPALAIDLLMRWIGRGGSWGRALILWLAIATTFPALFLATQWFFSKFLLSPAADNWFFVGNRYWFYGARAGKWQTEFWDVTSDPVTVKAMLIAWAITLATTAIGLCWGNWMAKVKR